MKIIFFLRRILSKKAAHFTLMVLFSFGLFLSLAPSDASAVTLLISQTRVHYLAARRITSTSAMVRIRLLSVTGFLRITLKGRLL